MPKRASWTSGARPWDDLRRELLGPEADRAFVAKRLGVGVRTLGRWETTGAPLFYELALVGLAVKLGRYRQG